MFIDYIKLLKNRNFRSLWLGQIISQFGDRLTQMALIGLVYRFVPGSSLGLAKMLSLAIIPVFLVSPVAGVYVDRWNKQKTMYLSDLLRGIFILTIPFSLFYIKNIGFIYGLIFLSFCAGRFFIPAKMAIIPILAAKEDILIANSLFSVTGMIAAVFGFGLGGIIVEKWGVEAAFLLDAGTFFVSALLVFLLKVKENEHFKTGDFLHLSQDALAKVRVSVLYEAKEGLKYLWKSTQTRYAMGVFCLLFAVIGSLYTVFIVFIQETLHTITRDIGWLAVGAGGGLFLGSLIYGKIGKKFSNRQTIDYALFFASIWLMGLSAILKFWPDKIFAFCSCIMLGVLISPIIIAVNTLIHQESENNFWGRIFSSIEVVIHIAFMVFMFLASGLAELMTPFVIIISVGIMLLFFSGNNILRNNEKK